MTAPRLLPACWAACLSLALLVTAAHAQSPGDYARGLTLTPTSDAAVQSLLVPNAVYRGATRADLADVRLFDAKGTLVPFALDVVGSSDDTARVRLPIFPLVGRPSVDMDALDVTIRRAPSGSIVSVRPATDAANDAVRAYVLDASGIGGAIVRLDLTWSDATADFSTLLRAESSDDLTNWLPWGEAQRVMRLRFAGDTLVRRSLELPPRRAAYVRLTWSGTDAPPQIIGIDAATTTQFAPTRRTARLSPLDVSGAEPQTFVFDTGALPLDQARIELSDRNTLLVALLASSATPDGPWTPRVRTSAYLIRRDDADLRSPAFSVSAADRYWRVQTADPSTPLAQPPTLEVGWTPARLLFLTRGEAPYTLAFGNTSADPPDRDPTLAGTLRSLAETDAADMAPTVSEPFDLGGSDRLSPDDAPTWHSWLLWIGLLSGVALLAVLALRLIQSMPSESSPG